MTNADLQAVINKNKEGTFAIMFDNQQTLYIGYNLKKGKNQSDRFSSNIKFGAFADNKRVEIDDLQFETVGTTDFVIVTQDSPNPEDRKLGIKFITYRPTECVQAIYLMAPGYEQYRIDPTYFR